MFIGGSLWQSIDGYTAAGERNIVIPSTIGTYGAFNAGSQVTLRVAVGNNAAPVVGTSPEYSGEFRVESYKPVIETGKAVMFEATLKPAIGSGTGVPVWGVMA